MIELAKVVNNENKMVLIITPDEQSKATDIKALSIYMLKYNSLAIKVKSIFNDVIKVVYDALNGIPYWLTVTDRFSFVKEFVMEYHDELQMQMDDEVNYEWWVNTTVKGVNLEQWNKHEITIQNLLTNFKCVELQNAPYNVYSGVLLKNLFLKNESNFCIVFEVN